MPTPYFRLFPYGWDIDVFYTRIRGRNVECAIFCKRVSQPFLGSLKEEDNAPRRPSEVTATSFGPKYCNISLVGIWCRFSAFFRLFPAGKVKTSDFFEGMFRCFAPKVRMFMAKKPGVFGGKSRFFRLFCRVFDVFCRRNGGEVPNIA